MDKKTNELGLPDSLIQTLPDKGQTTPGMRGIIETRGPLKKGWGIMIPNMRRDGPVDPDEEFSSPIYIPLTPPPKMTARPKRKKKGT